MDCKAKLLENLYTCFSDGGSFDNVRVNLGIDISRKAGEVPVAALNMKSEVDGAMEQDKSNTSSQLCRKRYFKMFALKMMPKGHQSISLHDEKDLTFIGIVKVICFGEHYNSNW